MKQLLADINPFIARLERPCRFKVPRRQVYCDTLQDWVHAVLWCHVVLRYFQRDLEQLP